MTKLNSPFLSIIIPTFNSAETITACLESIRTQTCLDLEVIIVDNLSCDATLSIVNGFKQFFPIKCSSVADNGIYDAMNSGIAFSSGSYCYFLGSDDYLYNPDVVQLVRDKLRGGNIKVAYGNVSMFGVNEWLKEGMIHGGIFDLKRLISHNICHQSIFYHNSIFQQLGNYNLKYSVYADHDFNIRCAAHYKLHYIDLIIAKFNVEGTSSSAVDPAFNRDRYANIVRYFFNVLHTKAFVGLRLYVRQAAFCKDSDLGLLTRAYCLLVYGKLKLQSFLQ
jgi:glycosyltransferase involved in cell wall biosynthesis